MNVRIKELIEEATIKERTNGAYGEHEWRGKLDPEKFARLIVLECSSICYTHFNNGDEIASLIMSSLFEDY